MLKLRKYRLRAGDPLGGLAGDLPEPEPAVAPSAGTAAEEADAPETARPDEPEVTAPVTELSEIRKEGLTGRQLRLARRMAHRHGLAVTSDFDAVRQLRLRGIDPFQQGAVADLVTGGEGNDAPRLPQVVEGRGTLPDTHRPDEAAAAAREAEIARVRQDIARRRRKRLRALLGRLAVFVLLPTLAAFWYFAQVATPMYATKTEFVIQQADAAGAAGLGGMFAGTSMATQQDSITVQSYLTSRAAMLRLDEAEGFKAHFSDPALDRLTRLDPEPSNEAAFSLYEDVVTVSYDPTEGIVRMEVIAADPDTSQRFSEALVGFAEEQVDQLSQRLRDDQMAGARTSYEAAEARREAALAELLRIQQEVETLDPAGETSARTQQIAALETERQQLQLELQTRLNVRRPNQAQVQALQARIADINTLIQDLREEMTAADAAGQSLAARTTELRQAEENYQFQTVLVQQALQQMEAAQIEANRQVRYLSVGVAPVAPDEATYPRVFENTLLTFFICAGLYLLVSLTASILREQVSA